jgi:hypothetical protein
MTSIHELALQQAELEQRVRAVEDVLAIERLKARYAQLVDHRYSRGAPVARERMDEIARELGTLFTDDAVWDGGKALGVAQGRAAIVERLARPTLLFSWHYFLKPQIQVDGDRASARWDLLSPCTTRDGRPHWMAGYEDDEYRRVDGAWLHRSMKLSVAFLAPHETGWEKILL